MNKMKMCALRSQFHLLINTKNISNPNSSFHLIPICISSQPQHYPTILSSTILPPAISSSSSSTRKRKSKLVRAKSSESFREKKLSSSSTDLSSSSSSSSRFLIVGGVCVGVAMMLMGMDEQQKAMALGPEGPLMEEFWDNVRRYGLYALTVSTGALYATFQPIYELLKNPISAILVLVILGGGIFIFSQVLYAMVGVSDFTYDYGN